MAPEMQIAITMTSAKATILSVILMAISTTGSFAIAEEESVCVNSFRKANAEYFKSHADLENDRLNSQLGAGVAGVATAAGVWFARRSIVGMATIGAIGTFATGGSYTLSELKKNRLQRLFDAHRLYQAYYSTIDETAEPSEYTAQFVSELGVDVNKEKEALKDMAGLMKWGALCEGEQPRSYDEVLDLMKTRLHAPQ